MLQAESEVRWRQDREAHGFKLDDRALLAFRGEFGKQYNKLTVESYVKLYVRPDKHAPEIVWRCRCSCAARTVREVRFSLLRAGRVKSCGRCHRDAAQNWDEQLLRILALTVEFEGSAGTYQFGPKLIVGVRDYSLELLQHLQERVGLGAITTFANARGVPGAQWQTTGREAQLMAERILPFSIAKREQLELILAYPLGDRSKRVTHEMRVQRLELENATKKLNVRGRRDPNPRWEVSAGDWKSWASAAPLEKRMEILAWAIEWEGTIGVYERMSRGSANGTAHSAKFIFPQVTHRRALLEVVQMLAGNVGYILNREQKNAREAPMSYWRLEDLEQVKTLCTNLLPYLWDKRPLAELVAAFPVWGQAPLPMPREMFEERRRLAAESKRLNQDDGESDDDDE